MPNIRRSSPRPSDLFADSGSEEEGEEDDEKREEQDRQSRRDSNDKDDKRTKGPACTEEDPLQDSSDDENPKSASLSSDKEDSKPASLPEQTKRLASRSCSGRHGAGKKKHRAEEEEQDSKPAAKLTFSVDNIPVQQLSSLECFLVRAEHDALFWLADFCRLEDLTALAAASKTCHKKVQGLDWTCQNDAVHQSSNYGNLPKLFANGQEDAGHCPACDRRICGGCMWIGSDQISRGMIQQPSQCQRCGRHDPNVVPLQCRTCYAETPEQQQQPNEEEGLFKCHVCGESNCRSGPCAEGTSPNGNGYPVTPCGNQECREMLCGNCYYVGYEHGFAPNYCKICVNNGGHQPGTAFCRFCAGDHLVEHNGCGCDNRELCLDHELVACARCGRQLCEDCVQIYTCQRCHGWAKDKGDVKGGCLCGHTRRWRAGRDWVATGICWDCEDTEEEGEEEEEEEEEPQHS